MKNYFYKFFDFYPYRKQRIILSLICRKTKNELKNGFIERYFLIIISVIPFISYVTLIRSLKNKDVYKIIEIAQLILILFLLTLNILQSENYVLKILSIVFAIYILIDLSSILFGVIFLTRYKFYKFPYSFNRSILMLCINYIQIIICFSIFYLASNSIAATTCHRQIFLNNSFDSLYFSLVTITTLGYGDFTPVDSLGKYLVILQLFFGFIFIVVIINRFMNIRNHKNERD